MFPSLLPEYGRHHRVFATEAPNKLISAVLPTSILLWHGGVLGAEADSRWPGSGPTADGKR